MAAQVKVKVKGSPSEVRDALKKLAKIKAKAKGEPVNG